MDMSGIAVSNSLRMLQSTASTMILDKSMGRDAQQMATMLNDMAAANPVSSFVRPGGMDIRV